MDRFFIYEKEIASEEGWNGIDRFVGFDDGLLSVVGHEQPAGKLDAQVFEDWLHTLSLFGTTAL